jgi:hypothetical protein
MKKVTTQKFKWERSREREEQDTEMKVGEIYIWRRLRHRSLRGREQEKEKNKTQRLKWDINTDREDYDTEV